MLKKRRVQAGLTQQELASKAGVSVSVVSNYERNGTDKAQLRVMRKLADALGCTVDDLLA